MTGWGKTLLLSFSLLTASGACVVGGEDDGERDDDDPIGDYTGDYDRNPGEEDTRLDALEIICESKLSISGTYTANPAQPAPAGHTGCWDVGTWTVNTITTDFDGCIPSATFESSYTFEAIRTGDDNESTEIRYVDDPGLDRVNLKITTAGDSLCHGAFALFLEEPNDFVEVDLQPTLNLDGTLSGIGSFRVHTLDPY